MSKSKFEKWWETEKFFLNPKTVASRAWRESRKQAKIEIVEMLREHAAINLSADDDSHWGITDCANMIDNQFIKYSPIL